MSGAASSIEILDWSVLAKLNHKFAISRKLHLWNNGCPLVGRWYCMTELFIMHAYLSNATLKMNTDSE